MHAEPSFMDRGDKMARYYFHIIAGELGLVPDTQGAEFTDLAAAHQRAVRIMYAAFNSVDDVQDWSGWRIKVVNANGRSVLTVLFRSGPTKRFQGSLVSPGLTSQ